MSGRSIVCKARRSVKNSREIVYRLKGELSEIQSVIDQLLRLGDFGRYCEACDTKRHIEERIEHHRTNIAKLRAFATLSRTQAADLTGWLNAAPRRRTRKSAA